MFPLFLLAVVATSYVVGLEQTAPVLCKEPRDCEDILLKNNTASDGLYNVCPEEVFSQPIRVLCIMEGRGWTTILNRFDGSVDFYQDWDHMKQLVGNLSGEFWLGLEPIHRLTTSGMYSMMVEMREGNDSRMEFYNSFSLSTDAQNYTLKLEGYDDTLSTTGRAYLRWHSNNSFTTYDRGTFDAYVGNCAVFLQGPNWFNSECSAVVHPLGRYSHQYGGWYWRKPLALRGRLLKAFPTELSIKIQRRGP